MKKLLVFYLILLLGITSVFAQGKMSPRLQEAVDQALEKDSPVRTLVMLKDRVDIIALDQELYARKASPEERAYTVITSLQEKAQSTQPQIVSALEGRNSEEVIEVQRFWVANMLMVEAVPSVLMELSERSDVSYMDLDALLQWDKPVARQPAPLESPNGIEPGIAAINAPAMWKAGYTGNGVIVMNIDTGVDGNHPAVSWKWRGTHVPSNQAWFDPEGNTTFPVDCDDHGTHTCGIMNGLNPSTNDTIGVAFGAEWIAAKTICSGPHTSKSISAFQWAMNPDGNAATVDDMPVGIGNSWWDPDLTASTQCDPNSNPYINVLTAVEAAGIGVVFSAGNSGPSSQSITTPKNVNINEVHFWATGAVDGNTAGFPIASFSSRGPVITSCQTGVPSLDIKPEASAPGVSVRSSVRGTGYSLFSGTSMAAPHVVGALALLKEAHPAKTGHELKMALYQTAVDLGTAGEDNTYGMGIIDVYAAHMALADPLDPRPPANVFAYSDYATPTSMMLTWNDPTNYENGDTLLPAEFTIEIERDGVFQSSVSGGTETYTDNGLTDGQLYTYTVYSKVTANDSTSSEVGVSWIAGGSPLPNPPHTFYVTQSGSDLEMHWTNPSRNLDGTPMDDFAGIKLYEDGALAATFTRTSSDTGAVDSDIFTPTAGTHQYYVTAFDNEVPENESLPSNIAYSPLALPFFDDFPTAGVPNAAYWLNVEAAVNDLGVNPPSPSYVLSLDGYPHSSPDEGDIVTLLPVDLSAAAGQGMVLSFWYQPQGTGNAPETADSLIVEFMNDQNQWITVRKWPGTSVQPFVNEVISIDGENPGAGATFFFPNFQFRFRNIATISTSSEFDHWLIDDVFLGVPDANPTMVVSPQVLNDTLLVGATDLLTFNIENTTPVPSVLTFNISEVPPSDWVEVVPTSGSVASNTIEPIAVNLNTAGLTAGFYTMDLIIAGSDTVNTADTVTVNLQLNDAPIVGFSPDTLVFSLDPGQIDSLELTISNTGAGPLYFTLRDEDILSALIDKPVIDRSYLRPEFNVEIPKGQDDWRRGVSPLEGSGGPDQYGYKWVDSDEPGGPVPNYIDISATGTVGAWTYGTPDDGRIDALPLPFPVKFYGIEYNSITIGSNGWLGFNTDYSSSYLSNAQIPSTTLPNNIVAGLWDDLNGNNPNSNVYYQQIGNKFIIQFHSWNRYGHTGGDLNFQYVFYQNADVVELQYSSMKFGTGTNPTSHTIGIENSDGTDGLQVVYNAAYMHDGLAIRFSKDAAWVSENPTGGTVPPAGSMPVQVIVNSTGLLGGDHYAEVIIESNDPVTPDTSAIVKMTVSGIPDIALTPDTLIFDTLLVGATQDLDFVVENNGTFPLTVSDITSTDPSFSADTTSFQIDPLTSLTVTATFAPTAAGTFSGWLEVASNDPDSPLDSVYVMGVANEAPVVGVTPDSFDVSLTSGDIVVDTLTITNSGNGPLSFIVGTEDLTEGLRVRALESSTRQFNTPVQVPENLKNLLPVTKMIPGGDEDLEPIQYTPKADALEGTEDLFVYGAWSSTFSGTTPRDRGNFYRITTKVKLKEHWLYLDLTSSGDIYHFVYEGPALSGSFNLIHVVHNPNSGTGEGWYKSGPIDVTLYPGNVYYIGAAWAPGGTYGRGPSGDSLMTPFGTVLRGQPATLAGVPPAATVSNTTTSNLGFYYQTLDIQTTADWISVDPDTAVLAAQSSMDLEVTFDPTGLLGGNYYGNIFVESNDPVTPRVDVGVHMLVIGQPVIATGPDPLVMDTTFTGGTDTKTLWVKNVGSDSLHITNITSTNPVFTVDTTYFSVPPPMDSFAVEVTFSPLLVGTAEGYIIVESNDPVHPLDSTMVRGEAVEAPVLMVNPLFQNPIGVLPGDSVIVAVNLANAGGSDLLWTATKSWTPLTELIRTKPSIKVPRQPMVSAEAGPGYKARGGMLIDAIWDLQFSFNLETASGALGNAGSEFDGTYYYTTRWASSLLHKFDMSGNLVEEFSIPGVSGLRDLAFDGTYMYGGAAATTIYVMDVTTKTLIGTISSPVAVRTIAYDSDNDAFWVGNWDTDLYLVDKSGNTLATIPATTHGLGSMYGSAYDDWSDGGPYLWVFDQESTGDQAMIYQLDLTTGTQTGITHNVQLDFPASAGIAGGLFTAEGIVSDKVSIGGVLQGTPDMFFVFELTDVPVPWLRMMEHTGVVAPGTNHDMPLMIYGMDAGSDTAYVMLYSNDPALPVVPIEVCKDMTVGIGDLNQIPTTFDVSQNFPNPFNPTTTIKYQLPHLSDVKLTIYNVLGQKVRTLLNEKMEPGYHSVIWNGRNDEGRQVASGIYIYRFEAGDYSRTLKLMLLK